jgi:hypothetical protein
MTRGLQEFFGALMAVRQRSVYPRWARRVAAALPLVLVATLNGPSMPASAAKWQPPQPTDVPSIPVTAVQPTKPVQVGGQPQAGTPAVTWPAAGTATVDLTGSATANHASAGGTRSAGGTGSAGLVRAGGMPIRVAAGTGAAAAAQPPPPPGPPPPPAPPQQRVGVPTSSGRRR